MSLIFAIGDIHGSLRKLQSLIERCEQYADGKPMTLIFLGDYIDRGRRAPVLSATLSICRLGCRKRSLR
jgi:predicted phosphodiesterase